MSARIQTFVKTLTNALTPHPLSGRGVMTTVVTVLYFKFLFFDLIWALGSTFSGFQFPIGYLTKLALATLLALPLLRIRRRWYIVAVYIITDLLLIANLMYFRTYFTIIPAGSYLLVGNLADFTDSVWESLRWSDIVFPLTTLAAIVALSRTDLRKVLGDSTKRLCRRMALWMLALPMAIVIIYVACLGGYKKAYDKLMYDYSTCGAAVYTIPGAMAYEWMRGTVELTPQLRAEINQWIATRPGAKYIPPRLQPKDNVIIILCESLESWVFETAVEGQELAPNINALLRDSATLYAPHVLSQVKGARSIDAQLILHTGLLPVEYGAYSYRFPHNVYCSLDKAWKQKYGNDARVMSFTVDKRTVWNVAIVAQDFGYEIYDKPNFVLDIKTGPRGRLGDTSFLRQSAQKIADPSMWPPHGHTMLQCVTYSGHTPFVIPDELKKVHFSNAIPERLRHYMEVANYTDRAIGDFVRRLKASGQYDNTTIIITGDHEGIGVDRASFVKNPAVAAWLSPEQYVPLVVLNSPVAGRHDATMGQIDLYPTLLDILGLDDYGWRGLGQSILDPDKLPFTINAQGKFVGDTSGADKAVLDHQRRMYTISDLIISSNYFKK